jgi:hypothetical protein
LSGGGGGYRRAAEGFGWPGDSERPWSEAPETSESHDPSRESAAALLRMKKLRIERLGFGTS